MPSELDLDGNSTMDFRYKPHGGSASIIESDGWLRMVSTGSSYVYFGSDDLDARIWKVDGDNYTFAEGYTIETSINVHSTSGAGSVWRIYCVSGGTETNRPAWTLNVAKDGQSWGGTALGTGTYDNTDGFHVFRVAQKENTDLFQIWRDNVLLGEYAAPGTTTGAGSMYFGDPSSGSGSFVGTVDVDYYRFTKGGFAPIPEPSTLILLVGGLLSLVLWRRR
jgi:hypothetical protein